MAKNTNIMIVGVGGQGVILASELICETVIELGYDVKKSEVHGMAQRGGSVVSNIKFGEKVDSPLISEGEADILLSFEQLETLRYTDYLNKDTHIIMNEQKIMPMLIATGKGEYPQNVYETLKEITDKIDSINALKIAEEAGNFKTVNVVLVGALSKYLDIPTSQWEKVIEKMVPPKTLEANINAFKLGREYA